jgi:hypothetical protein
MHKMLARAQRLWAAIPADLLPILAFNRRWFG